MMISATVGVLTLILTLFALWQRWWIPTSNRIRQALTSAEPSLLLGIGSYGGPMGEGFGINLQNKGTVSAHNLSLFLPGFDGAVWRITELPKGATPYKEIPIQHDAPIRTRRMEGLTARLVYHDRFGVGYEVVAGLTQEARADSYFNIAAHEMRVVKPTQRFVDLWRLRNRV